MYEELYNKIYAQSNEKKEDLKKLFEKIVSLQKQDQYEIFSRILQGDSICDLMEDIENKNLGLEGYPFRKQRRAQAEEDDFIANPAEVVEGVLVCNKCGSKRTVSYTLQTQSGDEGTAVWARCVECKATWRA